ncbi:hypothetical protein ABHF91_12790 [Pseudaeromonas sp. ZJS20]|uniref:hypothetical protein n=1 Tax=Pseudaeromonas aegiceratis TaxID=3153928 RepID=UPI00390CD17A
MRIAQQNIQYQTQYQQQQTQLRQQTLLDAPAPSQPQSREIALTQRQEQALSQSLVNGADESAPNVDLAELAGHPKTEDAALFARPRPSTPLSGQGRTDPLTPDTKPAGVGPTTGEDDTSDEALGLTPQLKLMKTMLESILGRKIELGAPLRLGQETAASPTDAPATVTANAAPEPAVRVLDFSAESEQLVFAAEAQVTTTDGRTIDLKLGFALDYQRLSLSERLVGESALKDPLVLNLDGQVAELQQATFDFDLDADGVKEAIPKLGSGSAFLALDRNGNGLIDDGSELFGAQSGNGFAELAGLDEDGNGALDEGDSLFAALKVWRPGGELLAVGEVGIGALLLHPVETPYQHLGERADGQSAGVLRQTGLYLTESGQAGTLQQLDLRV